MNSMDLSIIEDLKDFLKIVTKANVIAILLALDKVGEEFVTTGTLSYMLTREAGLRLSPSQLSKPLFFLWGRKILEVKEERKGGRVKKRWFRLSPYGQEFVKAVKQLIEQLSTIHR